MRGLAPFFKLLAPLAGKQDKAILLSISEANLFIVCFSKNDHLQVRYDSIHSLPGQAGTPATL